MWGEPLSLHTQCELAPRSERAERRRLVDGPHDVPIIIIRPHSINLTVSDGYPEALEHQFVGKTVLLFFSPECRLTVST